MLTLRISSSFNMSENNMPDGMFQYITQQPHTNDGYFTIAIGSEDNLQNVLGLLGAFSYENGFGMNWTRSNDNIVTILRVETQQQATRPEPDTRQQETVPEEDIAAAVAQAQQDAGPPVYSIEDVPNELVLEDISDNEKMAMIAAGMQNNVSSDANLIGEKQREYNRKWTEVLALGRQINDMTASIMDNPIVGSIIEQSNDLEGSENSIESVRFSEGTVIVRTKELRTSQMIEGGIRVIGRMKFTISLAPFVGSVTANEDPIQIVNMDRKVRYGSGSWECGHVPTGRLPCWGTAFPQLYSAYENGDLHAVVEVLIRYVTSPNPRDAYGKHIKGFPVYRRD